MKLFPLLAGWLFAPILTLGAFEFSTFQEPITESNPVTRTLVTDGALRFSFIAPKGWQVGANAAACKLTLQQPTSPGGFVVQLATNAPPADAAQLRSSLATAYQDVTVVDEFEAASGSRPGLGIQFTHIVDGRLHVSTRLAVYASPEGSVSLALTTPTDEAEKLHLVWSGFINSFRFEARLAPKK